MSIIFVERVEINKLGRLKDFQIFRIRKREYSVIQLLM